MTSFATGHGKIILLGEHAVVYGYPALCGALPQGARVDAVSGTGSMIVPKWKVRTAPLEMLWHAGCGDDRLSEAYLAVAHSLWESAHFRPEKISYDWVVSFEIPTAAGLGASAAVSVALTKAMGQALGLNLTSAHIAQAAKAAEQIFHGNASGLDAYLAQAGGFGIFDRAHGFTEMKVDPFTVCVGFTGSLKDTRARVERIAELRRQRPLFIDECMQRIAALVAQGIDALLSGDAAKLGVAMNQNQKELQQLEASTPIIERMCKQALDAGALGAKLTGGGGGGCVIAFGPGQEENILSVWQHAGFSSFLASLGSPSSCIDHEYEGRSRSL